MRTRISIAIGLLALSLAIGACASASADAPATIDEARATQIAKGAFEAFNDGDYAGWTRHWSGTMKSAISEEAFGAWRSDAMAQLGRYVALGTATRSSRQAGTYRWSFAVTFERGQASIGFSFANGRDEVEGVFVE